MTTFKNGQWVVGCKTSNDLWTPVSAKSLLGAKRFATNTYQISVGGIIQVAQILGDGERQRFVEMATKNGYNNWIDCP